MGKTSILFKKTGESKGKFHARRGMIKDKNDKDLTEREGTKVAKKHRRTIQKKKDLNELHNHYGVITHLEPHILECEVRWALGSFPTNKAKR